MLLRTWILLTHMTLWVLFSEPVEFKIVMGGYIKMGSVTFEGVRSKFKTEPHFIL